MSSETAQTMFRLKNINCIVIITLEGTEKIKTEKKIDNQIV